MLLHQKHVKVTNVPNVLRWLDLIQNIVVVKNNLVAEFPLVPVNLDDVPEPVIAAAGVSKSCHSIMYTSD